MRSGFRSLVFLNILLLASHAWAAEISPGNTVDEQGAVERNARYVSERVQDEVQALVQKLDLIVAGKQYTSEPNRTRLNLSQLVSYTEGGKVVKSTDLGVYVRLPQTEKRWQARFSTYDEEQESRDMQQRRVRTTPREREPGASLFFLRQLGDIKTTFQPKLQLKNPLEMSYVLKFDTATEFKPVRIKPQFQLFADAFNGTGEYFSLAFSWKVLERTEFTFDNEEEYHELGHSFTTRHGVTMDHSLTDDKAVGWALIASSSNHPSFHLETLSFSTSFTHEYYRDLLKYSLSPFVGFAKLDNFKGKVGVSFTLTFMM